VTDRARQILGERARKYAATAAQAERDQGREFLGFGLGGERYLVEARFVVEVAERELVPMPLASPRLLGLANLRGTLLPVFDLIRVLGRSSSASLGECTRLVVLGASVPEAAVLVESLEGVTKLEESAIIADERLTRSNPCVLGTTREAAIVLDGKALLDGPWLVLDDSNGAHRTPEVAS
jgi:purine-binding chemotaxis protein CheW